MPQQETCPTSVCSSQFEPFYALLECLHSPFVNTIEGRMLWSRSDMYNAVLFQEGRELFTGEVSSIVRNNGLGGSQR